ncbi:MAG: phytanoyl-CoA dioxygenase family protein [Myxococcales bacterium]|nr:phytanoyl-CoA dioxygenase family protein [Myxococcales bacterium]MCB9754957.1 phytanoyl-CoA dioxygenase family protein [Myxococcales bacterium]
MTEGELDASRWFPRYPIDEHGFARAQDVSDVGGLRAALERHGVVVVDALDGPRCERAVAAMFEEIEAMKAEVRARALRPARRRERSREATDVVVRPDDPETWATEHWPSPSKFLLPRPALHPEALRNRVDARVHRVFSALWGDERLRVTIDNWGVVRGTRGLRARDGSRFDRPDWDAAIGPHWDYNPWLWLQERAEGRDPGYQGLVALVDQPPGSGCHRTLPGCTRYLARYCAEREHPARLGLKRGSYRPRSDDPIVASMQELPLRRGHMVIWSWGQLHGSAPNDSSRLRLHQYIRMFPARELDPLYELHDRYAPARIAARHQGALTRSLEALAPELDLRARRLLGLERWPS